MSTPLAQSLSVVLVTYNSAHVLAPALRALPSDVKLIVVDNASTDESVDVVRAEFPRAHVIQSPTNLGFATAVNIGVAAAETEFVLLLNPDAIVTGESIAIVLETFASEPGIAIASPLVEEGSGELTTMAGGFEPTIWHMFTHASGLSRLAQHNRALRGHYLLRGELQNDALIDVDWVSGGCLFLRRDVWVELGGLSERWFMYAEDVDFCLRARDLGARVAIIPRARAIHAVGESSAGAEKIRTTWLENLFDLYCVRYGAGAIRRAVWRGVVSAGYASRSAVSWARSTLRPAQGDHDQRRFRAYAVATLRARPQRNAQLEPPQPAPAADARYYPVARVAHLERLHDMHPADFLYTSTRRDWDEALAGATAGVQRVSLLQLLRLVWTRDYRRIEVPEPLAITLLPNDVLIAIAIKARRAFRRKETSMVFYAIENFDQVSKVQSRFRVPAPILTFILNTALMIVFSETSRVVFGTSGAEDVYKQQLGVRRWDRIVRSTDVSLVPSLSAPISLDSIAKDPNLVCFLGSFEERKGIHRVIASWPDVQRVRPDCRLVIVGHGPLQPAVEQFAEGQNGVTLRVDPPRDEIREILRVASCLVLPSQRTPVWREQIGLPILEGLSAGCEIVTTTESGIAEWLVENGHHVVAPEASDSELAAAIDGALNSHRGPVAIQAALPSVDGRITADRRMFAG